jgi:hypothetical protein
MALLACQPKPLHVEGDTRSTRPRKSPGVQRDARSSSTAAGPGDDATGARQRSITYLLKRDEKSCCHGAFDWAETFVGSGMSRWASFSFILAVAGPPALLDLNPTVEKCVTHEKRGLRCRKPQGH